jgi:alpha-tubulin suppressor-like RCC1 family protein
VVRWLSFLLLASCRLHFDPLERSGDGGATSDGDATPCVVGVTTRSRNTCLVRGDGTVWCAGQNNNGQLGNNNTLDSSLLVRAGTLTGVKQVVNGSVSVHALDEEGRVWAWGGNYRNQLGDGTSNPSFVPIQVTSLPPIDEIAAGESHGCARAGGDVYCWGWNQNGQVGNSSAADTPLPVLVTTSVRQLAAGGRNTCVIKTDDSVWCWGGNARGEVGDGSAINPQRAPVELVGFTAAEVAVGGRFACARKTDGTVACWGRGIYGVLGNDTSDSNVPIAVPGITTSVALYRPVGGRRMCVRLADSSNWCWGETTYGTLGASTPVGIEGPVRVPALDGATLVAAASGYTCARMADGRLACGGLNDLGQLGDGTMITRLQLMPAQLACP